MNEGGSTHHPGGSANSDTGLTRFGVRRPLTDMMAVLLLLAGFSALAFAFWVLNSSLGGILLPAGFLVATLNSLRTEVREVEFRDDVLFVKTFFREYPMPRAHITRVVRTPAGVSVEVQNGATYAITPAGVAPEPLYAATAAWLSRFS